MPMAIDPCDGDRRRLLQRAAASLLGAAAGGSARAGRVAGEPSGPRLAAAWEANTGHHVGVLQRGAGRLEQVSALEVPTRAHGLSRERSGSLLAVARRPGGWLVRWHPGTRSAPQWKWIEPGRAFNGHALASADGKCLFSTETDLETGHGMVAVRDARSLDKVTEWPTHGMDPHALVLDRDGQLMVANGGIPTLPESGRVKRQLDRMDPSLVRLDTASGRLLGQWRLDDARLSLRHLAWGEDRGGRPLLGIAMQAEHDAAEARTRAPVLALFDGSRLSTVAVAHDLAGYGGDIAFARGSFAVSCPRAHGVLLHAAVGGASTLVSLDEACALASRAASGTIWAAGRYEAMAAVGPAAMAARAAVRGLQLDNHWLLMDDT